MAHPTCVGKAAVYVFCGVSRIVTPLKAVLAKFVIEETLGPIPSFQACLIASTTASWTWTAAGKKYITVPPCRQVHTTS
jgi:hypothetical protein